MPVVAPLTSHCNWCNCGGREETLFCVPSHPLTVGLFVSSWGVYFHFHCFLAIYFVIFYLLHDPVFHPISSSFCIFSSTSSPFLFLSAFHCNFCQSFSSFSFFFISPLLKGVVVCVLGSDIQNNYMQVSFQVPLGGIELKPH